MSESLKTFYRLYRPFFGLKKEKLKRTLALCAIIAGNFLLLYCVVYMSSMATAMLGALNQSTVTYLSFLKTFRDFVISAGFYGTVYGVNAWMANWLGVSLSDSLSKSLVERWIKTKAYYGISYMKGTDPSLDSAQVLSHDVKHLGEKSFELINDFLIALGNFSFGIYGLLTLSGALTFTLFSTSVTIPGYMAIGTVLYAYGCNYLTREAGKHLNKQQKAEHRTQAEIQNKVQHLNTEAESIAFKKGEAFEQRSLNQTLDIASKTRGKVANIQSRLNFISMLNSKFAFVFALILSAPTIISEKLKLSDIFMVMGHFENVVAFFTWKSDNFDKLSECRVSLEHINKMDTMLSKWEAVSAKNKDNLQFAKSSSSGISIKHLTVNKPDGTPILTNFNARVEKGATLLAGASGKGKTSILRSLAGVSPYSTGRVEGLTKSDKVHFIPSRPYFPLGRSLLDAIMYPQTTPATQEQVNEIKALMAHLGFKPEIIGALGDPHKNWNGIEMSDGERQRVEIISALMKKPDILFMDEATSRIDHDPKTQTKSKIERLLKERLPNAIILYTDHNPSEGDFCDRKIKLA